MNELGKAREKGRHQRIEMGVEVVVRADSALLPGRIMTSTNPGCRQCDCPGEVVAGTGAVNARLRALKSPMRGQFGGPLHNKRKSWGTGGALGLGIRRLPLCLDAAFMSVTPRYGLRYGSVPATGDFQRLRGRPPLVSPLKSCMGRSFTAVRRVQIPSGP